MEINNNTIINVCNYMPNKIIASTNSSTYVFDPCSTDNPVILPMSMGEVKELHSKSRIFADGWLSFEDDAKADVYKYLKIKDGDNILNQVEIMRSIISGTKDDVDKLIHIKSKGYFERVYGVYNALKQSNMYDISMRVAKAIEYRYGELQRGIINTQIELSDAFNNDNKDATIERQEQSIAEYKHENEAMQKTIDDLKEQVAALMSAMKSNANVGKVDNVDADTPIEKSENTVPTTTPAKRGRKPTK